MTLVVVNGDMTRTPKLLFADPKGKVMEHPYLLATLRSGEELVPPQDKPIPLPSSARLVHLPGRLPTRSDLDQVIGGWNIAGVSTWNPKGTPVLMPDIPGGVTAPGAALRDILRRGNCFGVGA